MLIKKIWAGVVTIFKLSFLPLLLIMVGVFVTLEDWNRATYLLGLLTICLIGDRLRDIKNSIDRVWYVIHKAGERDD